MQTELFHNVIPRKLDVVFQFQNSLDSSESQLVRFFNEEKVTIELLQHYPIQEESWKVETLQTFTWSSTILEVFFNGTLRAPRAERTFVVEMEPGQEEHKCISTCKLKLSVGAEWVSGIREDNLPSTPQTVLNPKPVWERRGTFSPPREEDPTKQLSVLAEGIRRQSNKLAHLQPHSHISSPESLRYFPQERLNSTADIPLVYRTPLAKTKLRK